MNQRGKKEKRIKRNEDNLRDLQDNIKHPNIRIIGVPEEEDKKKDHEKILNLFIIDIFFLLSSLIHLFLPFYLLIH